MAKVKLEIIGGLALVVLAVAIYGAWNLFKPDERVTAMEHAYTLTGYPAARCHTVEHGGELWMGCRLTSKDPAYSVWRELAGGWASVNGPAHTQQAAISALSADYRQSVPVVVNGNGYSLGDVAGAITALKE